jgi:predicted nucleotidyltransferase
LPYFFYLYSAFLFGSYAKNTQREDSDIDIAIVLEDLDDSNRFNTQVQLMLLAADIDSRIEAHPISKNRMNQSNPFAAEILKTGIKLKKPRMLTVNK